MNKTTTTTQTILATLHDLDFNELQIVIDAATTSLLTQAKALPKSQQTTTICSSNPTTAPRHTRTSFLHVVDQDMLSAVLSSEYPDTIQIQSSSYKWDDNRCIHDQLSSILRDTSSLSSLNFMEQKYVQSNGSLPVPTLWNADRFLGAAGLNSVMQWGMPYQNLSRGQRARALCALALIRIAQQFYIVNETTLTPESVFVLQNFDTVLDDATALSLSVGFGKAVRQICGSHPTSLGRPSIVIGVVREHLKKTLLGNESSSISMNNTTTATATANTTATTATTTTTTTTSSNFTKYFNIMFKSDLPMEKSTKQANIAVDKKYSPVPPTHGAFTGVSSLALTCSVANAQVTASSLLPFGITWSGINREEILYPSSTDPKKPVTVLFGPSGCGKTSILHQTCTKVVCCGDDYSSREEEKDRIATTMGNDIGIDEFGSFQQTSEELLNFVRWFMDMVEKKQIERMSVTTLDLSVAQVLMSHGARVWDVFRSRWLTAEATARSSSLSSSTSSSIFSSISSSSPTSSPSCYEIIEVNGQDWWNHFGRYHYMDHQGDGSNSHGGFNNAARTYLLLNENHTAIGLCATLSGMGIYQLGSVVREHRTVILPPYQGMGIGQAFVKVIAENYMRSGIGFFSRTRHPALVAVRNRDNKWKTIEKTAGKRDSNGNVAYSHFFIGDSTIRSSLVRNIVHTEKIHDVEKALNLLQKVLVGFSSKANSPKGCKELLTRDYTRFFDVPVCCTCCVSENSLMKEQESLAKKDIVCIECRTIMTNIFDGSYVSRLFKPQQMWWKTEQQKKRPEKT